MSTFLAALLFSASAQADGRAAGFVSVYADDDQLTVVSPQVSVAQGLSDEVDAQVGYDADIISAATVDVRTAASPRGYDEVRHGLHAGVGWQPETESTLGLRWMGSWEPDYRSNGIGASATHELFDRRLTMNLSAVARFDAAGRAQEPSSRWNIRSSFVGGASFGLVLDRLTVATLGYEMQVNRGFMGSPYRFVSVQGPSGVTVRVPEAHPKERVRHAARLGARRALSTRWFLSGGYRLYTDSWRVTSHTGDAEVQVALLSSQLILALGARGSYQSAASFYESVYVLDTESTVPVVRSADKLLAKSWSVLSGVRAEMNLRSVGALDALRAALKVEYYEQRFIDFAPLKKRRGAFVSLSSTFIY